MTEIRTILVLGIIIALLTGAASAMMTTTTQTAEARINDCSKDSGELCFAGGSSAQSAGLNGVGGRGLHLQCEVGLTTCSFSGGSGGNAAGLVGGNAAHLEGCNPDLSGCDTGVGGSGIHHKGPGGNSGN